MTRYEQMLWTHCSPKLSPCHPIVKVILMATAADGAAEFYSSETNAARSEPPELAIELDHVRVQRFTMQHAQYALSLANYW